MKAVKWILSTAAVLAVLFVLLLISLPFFINPNDFKERISAAVYEQTGRELSIPGDIKLSVSPSLDASFSLGEIKLASSKDFADTPFASSRLARIKMALLPLLRNREVKINTIELEGVQLTLVRRADGSTNWQDLAGKGNKETPSGKASQQQDAAPRDKTSLPALDIGQVDIRDINLVYDDRLNGKKTALQDFNLHLGHLLENTPFPLNADFTVTVDDGKNPLSAAIVTGCGLTIDLKAPRFILDGLTLDADLSGPAIPAGRQKLTLGGKADINLSAQTVRLEDFSLSQGPLTIKTSLSMKDFAAPQVSGTLRIPSYSPADHLRLLALTLPEFAAADALSKLSGSMAFGLENRQLNLKDIELQFDRSTLTGALSIDNLDSPVYHTTLRIDQLDLDRYMVKKEGPKSGQVKEEQKEPLTTKASSTNKPLIPVDLLKGLNFTADIGIGSLKAAKVHLTDIQISANGQDGLIRLQPLSASLYEGSLQVTGSIDVRGEQPVMKLTKQLQGVQLGPLCIDTMGREEFSGRADIELAVTTRGLNKKSLTENANGTVNLSLADGRIARLKILKTIRAAKALLDKEPVVAENADEPTAFARLTATGMLKNGIFTNNDLQAASELMKVTGKGTVDLVNEQIDYLLTVYLTDRIGRDKDTGLVSLGKTPIPYRIKGPFNKLSQSAALEELVKAQAKELLFDTIEKKLDNGKEKEKGGTDAGSLINKGLQSLFGN